MAAKYPEDGSDEDLYPEKNQDREQQLVTPSAVPPEANTLVLDDTASDVEDSSECLRGSQVATVYKRSWSEGSSGDNVLLDIKDSNFAKLVLLSTNICQDVMREIIRNNNPYGLTDNDLHTIIHNSETLRIKVPKNTREEMLLFPSDGTNVRYEQLDFSAMYKVARYTLSKQIAPKEKWSASPKPGAKCLMSSIEKLRLFRNDCSHSASASINSAEFQTKVEEVTEVILQIERLLRIPNKYSKRVRRLTKASLSQTTTPPRVIELETKSVDLEKQIAHLKDELNKRTGMTVLFREWTQHQQELMEVHRKLEDLYKDSSTDPEEAVPLLQRNLNVIEDDTMRETLEASLVDEDYFVETKGAKSAMKELTENNMVILAGRKGNGKERLAHHLLCSLMSKSECQTHIVDSMFDVKKCFETKSHETVIVLLHEVFIDKETKALINKRGKDTFKKKSNRYLIMTSVNTTHLVGLKHLVNLSAKEFELSVEERRGILKSHLDRCSKKSSASYARLNEKEVNEIVNIKCSLEFPLACFLFTTEEKYFLKGSNFFRYPIDYFLGELKSLTEQEYSVHRIFFELLLQQDESSPVSFETPGIVFEQRDMKQLMEEAELEISDLAELGDKLSYQGTLIQRIPHTQKAFTFRNETVEQAAQILMLETNFKKALEMFNSEILVRCIAINPGLKETCLFTTNSSKDQECIAKKILNDIFAKNISESIWSSQLAIWNDKDFVDLFARMLLARLKREPGHRDIIILILKQCALNRLLILCKAITESLQMSQMFMDDFSRFISYTLLDACRIKGNLAIVKLLVANKADLSFSKTCRKQGKLQCPLECAAESNDQHVVRFLLQSGARIPHSKWKFWDFLKVAAEKEDTFLCNIPLIRTLSMYCRDKAVTVNSRMEEFIERTLKYHPSRELDRNHFFFDCLVLIGINNSLYSAFRDTIFQGSELPKGDQCENACHMILESLLDPEMELRTLSVLANMEFDMLNEKDNCGYTPLAKAVKLGKNNNMLSQMLLQKARADETDNDGKTALHLAILSAHPDAWVLNFVNTLTGPNITCQDIMGATPVQLCISKGRNRINTLRRLLEIQQRKTVLPNALFHDCVESSIPEEEILEIMQILKEFGSDPNTEDDSKVKPLAKAVNHLYLKIMNTFLQWNVDVDNIDGRQNTILHYCCDFETPDGEYLLDAFIKYYLTNETTLNKKNDKGRNAIMAYLAEPDVRCISSQIVWRFLNMEPDLSIQDVEGNTALHYLMQSSLTDEEVLNFTQVMINDFHVRVSVYNAGDSSPLMLALTASRSRFNTVKFILSMCDHIPTGETGILQLCIRSCMNDDEVRELSQLLIQQGGISTNKPDVTGLSPLFTSIQHSLSRHETIALMLKYSTCELCTGVISELIKHDKLDPYVVGAMHRANIPLFKIADKFDFSVFHFLIREVNDFPEFHDLVVSFLPFGHDINHVDSKGLSPLFHACREDYPVSIVSALLSNGARGYMPAKKESALHLCVRSKRNDEETRDIVIALLNNNSMYINVVDGYHTTALAAAVCQAKFLTAKALLENEADPNIPDRENKIALHHCVEGAWSDQNTCAFLLLLLPKSQINWQDGDDRSALDIAACHVSFSRIFSIILLLTTGCTIKTVDRLGRSPLHNTVRCLTGNLACCKLERLCRMGAFLNFGMSPICKDDEENTAIDVCVREKMNDEIKVLNSKQLDLGICREMMSMLRVGEVSSDPVNTRFTEDIGSNAFSEEVFQLLTDVACCLHGIDISKC